jgi:hypothetical protein
MSPRWLFATVPLLLVGCSAGADTQSAERAAVQFHQLLNAGDASTIYDTSADAFKRAEPKAHFAVFLAAVHRKLGDASDSKPQNTNVNYTTNGQFITLVYNTKFSSGTGAETFVYSMDGGAPKLVGYHINSEALILN